MNVGAVLASLLLAASAALADDMAPPPDARFKADILLVVAHPDDDTLVAGYLARAIDDERRRVAVVYGTRGQAGGNAEGAEQGKSLAAIREIEARHGLAALGIENVWFLEGRDTASQNVLHSLETWGHGAALEQTVRLIRLTRPEVVMTWLPMVVAGENHGDHQAAGVIATEAFDLAADETAFPSQVAAPRDRHRTDNLTEGLCPWQPKKLYYFTDATDSAFLAGHGPEYSYLAKSPARGVSYAERILPLLRSYRTQTDSTEARALLEGDAGKAVAFLTQGKDAFLPEPLRLLLSRSLVGGSAAGDVFEGVTPGPIPRASSARPAPALAPEMQLGGPWAFYRAFWDAHGLSGLAGLQPAQVRIAEGSPLRVPLIVRNGGSAPLDLTIRLAQPLPAAWSGETEPVRVTVPPHDERALSWRLVSPSGAKAGADVIAFRADSAGHEAGSARLEVHVGKGGLPYE